MIDKPITDAECAYLAGLIDSRGKAYIRRESKGDTIYRKIVLQVGPIKAPVSAWITAAFVGGTVRIKDGAYTVSYVGKSAAAVCYHTYPYLVAKKDDARLVTRFSASLKGHGFVLSEESEKIRLEVDRDLKALHAKRKAGKA